MKRQTRFGVDWHSVVFEVIDMRSFSNLWFWIVLAVLWSTTSHWVLGVPFDMVGRAQRNGGQAGVDLEDMVRININRLLYISGTAGLLSMGGVSFVLTSLLVLGFFYSVEFAQAVFLLGFPMSLVGLLSIRNARRIVAQGICGQDLCDVLSKHRFWTQVIGMLSIFVTALWGMYQNLAYSALIN